MKVGVRRTSGLGPGLVSGLGPGLVSGLRFDTGLGLGLGFRV